jgi:methylaspartate ammonia-lyase
MFISEVLCVPVRSGFFADDQAAILKGAVHDGFGYTGEAVSVMLVLDDGQIGHGDCAAVQYSGVGGRDVVFDSAVAVPLPAHSHPQDRQTGRREIRVR